MRINQLNSYSNIQPSDTLLISNNSIDYQCTVQDLISNALIFPNLVIGTDTSPVSITASKIAVNSITVNGLPQFGTSSLGSNAKPIYIEDGILKECGFSFSSLGTSDTSDSEVPSSKIISKAISDAKSAAIDSAKVTNTHKYEISTNETSTETSKTSTIYYILGTNHALKSGESDQIQKTNTSEKVFVEYKDGAAWFNADYVVNAVWNDIADYLNVDKDTKITYGRAYTRDAVTNKVRLAEKNERIIGIASDTCGFHLGKNDKEYQIPIALGGWVLAYVDKAYLPNTPLKVGKNNTLTKASRFDEILFPTRIVASFDRVEKQASWHGKTVDGRSWVKIK